MVCLTSQLNADMHRKMGLKGVKGIRYASSAEATQKPQSNKRVPSSLEPAPPSRRLKHQAAPETKPFRPMPMQKFTQGQQLTKSVEASGGRGRGRPNESVAKYANAEPLGRRN